MRSILVPLFYLWLCGSIAVLIHRRWTAGSFRAPSGKDRQPVTEPFSTPPPTLAMPEIDEEPPVEVDHSPAPTPTDAGAVAVKPSPRAPSGPKSDTLADALVGIVLPCDLMPVVSDREDTRVVVFANTGHEPATVGSALADELERLGYEIDAVDSRTIDAVRDGDRIEVKLISADLDSPALMETRFPNARPDALVVELRLV